MKIVLDVYRNGRKREFPSQPSFPFFWHSLTLTINSDMEYSHMSSVSDKLWHFHAQPWVQAFCIFIGLLT